MTRTATPTNPPAGRAATTRRQRREPAPADRRGRALLARLGRPAVAGVLAALLTGGAVLVTSALADQEYEGRISVVASPVTSDTGNAAQYGEVVALALPALAELARGPSVLAAAAADTGLSADQFADGISVELVPASGLARLAVRAPSAALAGTAATAIADAVIRADLLAPAGTLRQLDERPEVNQVAPDPALAVGLALVGAVLAGVTAAALRHLRGVPDLSAVRAALGHPVAALRAEDPDLPARLGLLCAAADRPGRVLAVTPGLTDRADALAGQLPDTGSTGDAAGSAVVAVAPRGRRQTELAALAGVLPATAVLVAVVLA